MAPCVLCDKIAQFVKRPDPVHYEKEFVWNYRDVLQNQECSTCQSIIQYFKAFCGFSSRTDWVGRLRFDTDVWKLDWVAENITIWPLSLIHIGGQPDCGNAVGVTVDKNWIDLASIQGWIRQCDKDHAGTCHSVVDPWEKIEPATGLLFIDVERSCLAMQPMQPEECRYAALSYVWGKANDPFQTTTANFDQLCKDGAFDLPANLARIPRTIEHSMALTRALEIKYLWVDRFSIKQDDFDAKPKQLAAMASIYANSYITIAATEGDDDNFGLPGLVTGCPRRRPFKDFDFGSGCRMMERYLSVASYERPRYHTRGWTFQEWGLSRRLLLFHNQTVSWICHKVTEQENGVEIAYGVNPYDSISSGGGLTRFWTRWPNIIMYLDLVEQYSKRDLSNPEDILAAFAAIVTVQGRAMRGGILYGLPELFFGLALLWMPSTWNAVQRRTGLDGRVLKQFPSWSWAGWSGEVDTVIARYASTFVAYNGNPEELIFTSVVDFYKVSASDAPKCKERIQEVHSLNSEYQGPEMNNDLLPEGETLLRRIPLVEHPEAVALHTDSLYSTIIEFRTRRLFLHMSGHWDDGHNRKHALFADSSGNVVGVLYPPLQSFVEGIPNEPVELICIGAMEVKRHNGDRHADFIIPASKYLHRHCPESCLRDRTVCKMGPDWTLKCYNILWIEWEDGVAYREGIGMVLQDEWDAADTEEVDIRLG